MNYQILKQSTGEPLGALELHVLARAYHAAWRRIYGSEPIRGHTIPSLDVLIDFGALIPVRRVPPK
jgi:hypothetical protein